MFLILAMTMAFTLEAQSLHQPGRSVERPKPVEETVNGPHFRNFADFSAADLEPKGVLLYRGDDSSGHQCTLEMKYNDLGDIVESKVVSRNMILFMEASDERTRGIHYYLPSRKVFESDTEIVLPTRKYLIQKSYPEGNQALWPQSRIAVRTANIQFNNSCDVDISFVKFQGELNSLSYSRSCKSEMFNSTTFCSHLNRVK